MTEISNFVDAVYRGDLKEVNRVLKAKEVDLFSCKDSKGNNPLHLACLNGDLAVIDLMVDHVSAM